MLAPFCQLDAQGDSFKRPLPDEIARTFKAVEYVIAAREYKAAIIGHCNAKDIFSSLIDPKGKRVLCHNP